MMTIFLIGRIIFGGFFIYNGIGHFLRSDSMAGYAASKGIPMAKVAVLGTGILLILGGLSIILGMYVTIGIIALIAFLVVTTLTMHQFWKTEDPMHKMVETINFTKNLALVGALLMLLALLGMPIL